MRVTGRAYQRGASKLVIILLVLLIVILLGVGTAAALYLTGVLSSPGGNGGDEQQEQAEAVTDDAGESEVEKGPAQYMKLDDPITVNIDREGGRRAILQARVEFMARDEEVLKAVETHLPVVRNNLISLFGDQTYGDVSSREGKNALREKARDEVNAVLESEGESAEIEAVYFTQLVTQ